MGVVSKHNTVQYSDGHDCNWTRRFTTVENQSECHWLASEKGEMPARGLQFLIGLSEL